MSALDLFLVEVKAYDYKWFDEIGGNDALQEIGTLRAQLAEAQKANERLAKRLDWIRINPNDGVAARFAIKATDEEVDDIRSKEQVTTA